MSRLPESELRRHTSFPASRARNEQGELSRWPDLRGVEILTADYKNHAYVPHWHDTYTIALVAAGCERVRLAGSEHHVVAGDVVLLNPGEIHDGEAFDASIGWDFRAFYLAPDLLRSLQEDGPQTGGCKDIFEKNIVNDPVLWRTFLDLHHTLSNAASLLERSSNLLLGMARLRSELSLGLRQSFGAPRALERARAYLHAKWSSAISLDELATVAGISRFYLIREFKKRFGLPPHAYQLQLRVLRKGDAFLGRSSR